MDARTVIAAKRDGERLTPAAVGAFVAGLCDGSWSDAQAAAFAMAVVCRGMDGAETAALTDAMARSGDVLDWRRFGFDAPVLDKHSTGGVGDKTSLVVAPIVAACGGLVPMVSGRGLGHTGGTLDKLEALPGYDVDAAPERIAAVLRAAGCAIVGAGPRLAPADRRLYAVRDLTATVESTPLIVASILSKKRAAGIGALVLDVKAGSGAFAADAPALAQALVAAGRGAGIATRALVTDMSQVLGTAAGNALEVREALAVLRGEACDERLASLSLALAAEMLVLGGLADDAAAAAAMAARALASGAAAERFARMVSAQGGPRDVLRDARLATAPVQREVTAGRAGHVAAIDVRAVGRAIVALGGGRRNAGDAVDPRVGIDAMLGLGAPVAAGDAVCVVHAASWAEADAAADAIATAVTIADAPPAPRGWRLGAVG